MSLGTRWRPASFGGSLSSFAGSAFPFNYFHPFSNFPFRIKFPSKWNHYHWKNRWFRELITRPAKSRGFCREIHDFQINVTAISRYSYEIPHYILTINTKRSKISQSHSFLSKSALTLNYKLAVYNLEVASFALASTRAERLSCRQKQNDLWCSIFDIFCFCISYILFIYCKFIYCKWKAVRTVESVSTKPFKY